MALKRYGEMRLKFIEAMDIWQEAGSNAIVGTALKSKAFTIRAHQEQRVRGVTGTNALKPLLRQFNKPLFQPWKSHFPTCRFGLKCLSTVHCLAFAMRFLTRLGLASTAAAVALFASTTTATEPRCFPADFLFGSATASYQVEGAWNEGGRTPSIWDDFCRERPGVECANVADDFYHRYADDIKLMVETGLQSFRFSVSWSRVMNWDPTTRRMRPNEPGLAFYHALLDKLRENGISPILTMYHWDLPTELHNQLSPQGWLNTEIIDHFVQYATLLFHEFGGKVDFWTTFNEPLSFVVYGYNTGLHPPGLHDSPTLEVAHNVLLAHAQAVKTFRELKSVASGVVQHKARIGIVLNANQFYPLDASNPKDVAASERAMDFEFGWWLLPLTSGDYPPSMRERVGDRLPRFTPEQAALVKGSYDVFMLNHYYSRMITDCDSGASNTPCSSLHVGFGLDKGVDDTHLVPGSRPGLEDSQGNNYCKSYTAYPPGYLDTMKWMHAKDPTAEILLTENGWCGNDAVENMDQLWFFQTYAEQVYKAVVEEKIPVIGYTAWSFLDNYEWGSYGPRFGLYYVNFTTQTGSIEGYTPKSTDLQRIPRPSAKWFSKLATTGCLDDLTKPDEAAAIAMRAATREAMTATATGSMTALMQSFMAIVAVGAIVLAIANEVSTAFPRPHSHPRRAANGAGTHNSKQYSSTGMAIENVTAIVVGDATGLGKAFAETILAAGGKVMVMDTNAQETKRSAAALQAQYGVNRVCSIVQDSAVPGAFHIAFDLAAVVFDTSVNLVVNNAALSGHGSFDCNTPRSWESVVAIDLITLMRTTQEASVQMEAVLPSGQEGVIINLAMVGGLVDMPFWPAYAAAKAGVLGFTKSMAPLKACRNIRVMTLCPGFVATGIGHYVTDAFPGAMRGRCGLVPVETVTKAFVRAVEDGRNAGRCMIVLEGRALYYEANFTDSDFAFRNWRSQITT
ncbi:hypothetical protein BBJ28_00020220 [Nothophytophthora sp. Chile5]|nr:hypothetical protein BBJ28_00020220 [Nothophytophthora sp. Chile5]